MYINKFFFINLYEKYHKLQMKKFFLLLKLILFTVILQGQGHIISIDTQLPSSITICGEAQSVNIIIFNPSPFDLSNITLNVTMPEGLNYVVGSVSGATELNISNLHQPIFTLSDIESLNTIKITFYIKASCELGEFLSEGNIISINAKVNYTTNTNIVTFDEQKLFI